MKDDHTVLQLTIFATSSASHKPTLVTFNFRKKTFITQGIMPKENQKPKRKISVRFQAILGNILTEAQHKRI